jgi:hypothetical protein
MTRLSRQLLSHLSDDYPTFLTVTGKAAWFEIVSWSELP